MDDDRCRSYFRSGLVISSLPYSMHLNQLFSLALWQYEAQFAILLVISIIICSSSLI